MELSNGTQGDQTRSMTQSKSTDPALRRSVKEIVSDLETVQASSNCALLLRDELEHVYELFLDLMAEKTSPDQAIQATSRITGVYRKSDLNDPEMYSGALIAVFSEYPPSVITRASHPVYGLPSRCKFLPTVAEVREACDAETRRHRTIASMAKWQIHEHERREKAEKERRELKLVDPSRVDEILARFRGDRSAA